METGGEQNFLGVPAVLESPAMKEVIALAKRVAASPVAVLITGETGAGKEIVARAIHQFSLRCSKPWVDINCAASPEHLIESELFGHEKGAFSGADNAKPGLFEMADGGTLFLDEVGELDPRMQVKLLRVLDGAPYYRIGGRRKISVDARVVAATNQELERQIAAGRFRSDLYHRLNQFRIRVPPLRERVEDIIPIARYFLSQYSQEAVLSEDAQAALRRYAWPGNVRELRNVIAHAVVCAQRYEIHAADLPFLTIAPPAETGLARNDGLALDEMERSAILEALGRTGGHHQRAANLLGISRRTLSRKLRIYRMQREEAPAYSGYD